jgi:hypothetical protein
MDPSVGDFNQDCAVDLVDAFEFAVWWLAEDCSSWNDWCLGWDFDRNGCVDIGDFGEIAGQFGEKAE